MFMPSAGIRTVLRRLWLVCVSVSGAFCAAGYLPPLSDDMPLTSTFGEYRTRHFHGGLDFSTGGETGMKVFAVAPGYVWRIRVSGAGYGKALYIKLDDGRTAVYAHLRDFSDHIQQVVDTVQRRSGRYLIDHILEGVSLRVEAGELIAFSGDSGAGPAHLHFELRQGDTQINPLETGLRVTDTRPPRIRSIVLIPLGPHSMVDGRHEPLAVGLRWDRTRSVYRTSRAPVVQGDVAVACRLYDVADGKPNRLAPYGATLLFDGDVTYDVSFDSVSLGSTHEVELVYNYDYARRGGRNMLNLFCAPGRDVGLSSDETPMRGVICVEGSGREGAIKAAPGSHSLRVEAWDFSGNRRAAEMNVIADCRPVLTQASVDLERGLVKTGASDPDGGPIEVFVESSLDAGGTWRLVRSRVSTSPSTGEFGIGPLDEAEIIRVIAVDKWQASSEPAYFGPGLCVYVEGPPRLNVELRDGHVEAVCEYPSPSAHAPELWLVGGEQGGPIRSIATERTGPASFRAALRLDDSLGADAAIMAVAHGAERTHTVLLPLGVTRVGGHQRGDVALPGGATLVVTENTFFEEVYVRTVIKDSLDSSTFGELIPLGRPLKCDPPTQFFQGAATLYLPIERTPGNSDRVGLYHSADERRWSWVGNKKYGGGLVGGNISHFSVFAIMEDVQPPKVTRLRPHDGARIRNARPTLQARIQDKGSGLDWDSVYFTIDGERLITAWEADRGHVWVRVPYDLDPGPHDIEFSVADRAGNEAVIKTKAFVER